MAGFTEVGGLQPPQAGGGEGRRASAQGGGSGDREQGRYVAVGGLSWRGRLISQAPQLGRTGCALLSPGLRGTLPCPADAWRWAALRSEPGIPSARTLRGSEDASPSGRRREERGERAVGIEDKAGQGRGVDGVRALCGGGWPGLAQAADLAGSAARPNRGRRAPPPGLRGALPRREVRARHSAASPGGYEAAPGVSTGRRGGRGDRGRGTRLF